MSLLSRGKSDEEQRDPVTRALDGAGARRFYDRFGSKQDWQSFYEDPALDLLVRHAGFQQAQDVFEFGCGTGRFAERLLSLELPSGASYVALDISATMVDLATHRLARFGRQARVSRSDGGVHIPLPDARFDRFVSTYVLDLLTEQEIPRLLTEARRLLVPGGRLCVVTLTHGPTLVSRLLSRAWAGLYAFRPVLVGGCRPIEIQEFLDPILWRPLCRSVVAAWAVPSEVIVAEVL